MTVPKSKTALQAFLAAHGLHPTRLKGQHFLVDANLVEAIVRQAEVEAGDCVLEVGTGTGILTEALAARAGCVVSCDIDSRLLAATRSLPWPNHVLLLEADILQGKHRLNPEVIGRWQEERRSRGLSRLRVVSNLPYAVATPFLANLLWDGYPMGDAVVLVQREAAERFTARPRTGEYGPMAIAVGLLARAEILRQVGTQVFWPAPKVQSAVLRLSPNDPDRARRLKEKGLPGLLQGAFLHRRKTLRHAFPEEKLRAAGIDPGARPEEVPPEAWPALLEAD